LVCNNYLVLTLSLNELLIAAVKFGISTKRIFLSQGDDIKLIKQNPMQNIPWKFNINLSKCSTIIIDDREVMIQKLVSLAD